MNFDDFKPGDRVYAVMRTIKQNMRLAETKGCPRVWDGDDVPQPLGRGVVAGVSERGRRACGACSVKWADAVRGSKMNMATRKLVRDDDILEPNVLLIDSMFSKTTPKAFHVAAGDYGWGEYGWVRVKLRLAKDYDDWEPKDPRNAVDEIAKLAPDREQVIGDDGASPGVAG